MADNTPPSPRQQRSWRAEAPQPATPLARRIRLLTIVGVGALLAAAMAYALWPRHKATTHIAYLPVFEYKVQSAPLWPRMLLSKPDVDHFALQTGATSLSLSRLQTSAEVLGSAAADSAGVGTASTLALDLRQLANHQDDRLLLLVSAQGVSIDGKAFLLFGDFDATRSEIGRVAIEELLAQASSCQAGHKVLVLDAGNIVSDPRFGMLTNEFPRLLEEAVRQHEDPNLWVLVSNGTWEISHVSHVKRRSVFSYYVAQGLRGEANRADAEGVDDGVVDLAELYDYVWLNVTSWVEEAHGSSQSPALLAGGKGLVSRLADVASIDLMPVLPPEEEPPLTVAPAKATSSAQPEAIRRRNLAGATAVLAIGAPLALAQAATPAAGTNPPATPAPATTPPATPASTPPTATEPAPEGAAPPATPAANPTTAPAPATTPTPPAPAPAAPAQPTNEPAPAEAPSPPAAPARPMTPEQLVQDKLKKGWALRDRVERETRAAAARPSSPADFAPHLWREFQERLLGYETQYRFGEDLSYVQSMVDGHVLLLADMLDNKPVEQRHRNSLIGPLAAQWKEFQRITAQSTSSEAASVVRARETRDDALVRAPYYVRWYAVTSVVSPGDEPRFEDVEQLLNDVLALSKALTALRLNPQQRADEARLNELATSVQAAETRLQASAPLPGSQTSIAEVDCYLSTPLARAADRAKLLDWLRDARQHEQTVFDKLAISAPERSSRPTDSIGRPADDMNIRWQRVRYLARLEAAAAAIVDPASGGDSSGVELTAKLDALREAVSALDAGSSENLAESDTAQADANDALAEETVLPEKVDEGIDAIRWRQCRQIGLALQGYYTELNSQLDALRREIDSRPQNSPEPLSPQVLAAADRLYHALDARDANLDGEDPLISLLYVPPDVPEVAEVTFETPERIDLDPRRETTPLLLVARLQRGRANDAWLAFHYDPELLEIIDSSGATGAALMNPSARVRADLPQRAPSFSFEGGRVRAQQLNFEVRALPAARNRLKPGESTQIVASLYYRDADNKLHGPDERTILLRPALPEVELVVEGPKRSPLAAGASAWSLRPFPNTTTNYQLKLINRGSEPQEVEVQLIAVPRELGELIPKQWPLDESGHPIAGAPKLEVLATGKCTVPTGEVAVPVSFAKPAPPPPAAGAAAPPPAATDSADPPPKPITYGLVCLLKDKAGRLSVVNLDIQPKRPTDYLEVNTSWDPQKPQRVKVVVGPKGGDRSIMPPAGSEVHWHWHGEINEEATKKDKEKLIPPDFSPVILYADMPQSRSEPVVVRLEADGVPRAFIYKLEVGRAVGAEQRSLQQVRITDPGENGTAFAAPAASIPIAFEVDAQADAFSDPTRPETDLVEIGLVEAQGSQQFVGKPQRFYSDRQVESYFVKANENGDVTISTNVTDFKVNLPTDGRSNERVGVLARFARLARGQREVTAYREVFLDAARPEVLVVGQLPEGMAGGVRVEKGKDARVFAEVDDLGGVEKVEFFLVKYSVDLEKHWEHDDKVPPESATPGVFRNQRWEATVPTAESKDANLQLLVRATDRVGLRNKRVVDVEIVPPAAEAAPGKPAAKFGDLKGVVTGDGVSLIRVRLDDSDREVKTPRVNQEFVFEKLPPGEYKLTVDATVRNVTQPSRSVSVTIPQDRPVVIPFGS